MDAIHCAFRDKRNGEMRTLVRGDALWSEADGGLVRFERVVTGVVVEVTSNEDGRSLGLRPAAELLAY